MNIIKLKDIIMPDSNVMSGFFNESLKGRYAYWIQLRYIFPMEMLDYKTYIAYEQADEEFFTSDECMPHIDLYSQDECMHDFVTLYVDRDTTEKINDSSQYSVSNRYIADANVDISMLRRFRSWLAGEILTISKDTYGEYDTKLSNEQIHMLEYYRDGMYNDVVKYLMIFGTEDAINSMSIGTKSCGCCNESSLYDLSNIMACDALKIYIKNIHSFMVKTFEEASFWTSFSKEFIKQFKIYIDNIIRVGFTISLEPKNVIYNMCSCEKQSNDACYEMLQRLSKALSYIIDDKVTSNKLFIHDALYDWAEYMYDKMQWEINK